MIIANLPEQFMLPSQEHRQKHLFSWVSQVVYSEMQGYYIEIKHSVGFERRKITHADLMTYVWQVDCVLWKNAPEMVRQKSVWERSFFSTPHQSVVLTRSRVWVLKLNGLSNPAGRATTTFPYRDQHSFRSICDLNTPCRGPLSSSPCPSHSFCKT